MSAKGNRFLVGDVVRLILANEGAPLWISYDRHRCRFSADVQSRPGRHRVQVGPYSREHTLWQIQRDIEAAVAGLKSTA